MLKRDDWSWIVSTEDIDLMITNLANRHASRFSAKSESSYFAQVGRLSEQLGDDSENLEYQDALRMVILDIETIWHHIFRQVEMEVASDCNARRARASEKDFNLLREKILPAINQWLEKPDPSF